MSLVPWKSANLNVWPTFVRYEYTKHGTDTTIEMSRTWVDVEKSRWSTQVVVAVMMDEETLVYEFM